MVSPLFVGDVLKSLAPLCLQLLIVVKKGEFKWTKYVPKAFEEIEEKLIVALVLRLLDFLKAFKVACDAPRIGIGGV